VPAERLALYTTVYPGVEPYLTDWHDSVLHQTDDDFDLCIGLDALRPAQVMAAIGREVDANWIEARPGASPAKVRADALGRLVGEYPAVVLVDSDDVLYPSRVAAARTMLEDADVTACALDVMDVHGRSLDIVFEAPAGTDAASLLARYNVFGFSNTAYRSATLRDCLPVPEECRLIDWLLATRAWSDGATLSFDSTPRMGYRQYAANVAPMLQPFSADQILAATGRVLAHYSCVLDRGRPMPDDLRHALTGERARVAAFELRVCRRPNALAEYVSRLNQLPPMRVWWWQVAHPELEPTWTS
jgi:hypothetical protein